MAINSEQALAGHDILLFDGVCNLCNSAIQFVLRRDPSGRFKFVALQSALGQSLAEDRGISIAEMNSMVLISGVSAYIKSDAALRVARHLGAGWPLLAALLFLPRSLRDWFYDLVAANRYRWFGRRDACMVPSPEFSERFPTAGEPGRESDPLR